MLTRCKVTLLALGIRQLVRWPILAAGSIIANLMLTLVWSLLATALVAAIFFLLHVNLLLPLLSCRSLDTVSYIQMLSGILSD